MAAERRPEGRTAGYLVQCDGLRGVAILLVVLFHAILSLPEAARPRPGVLSSFVVAGNTGVTLFFVLSGFLLDLPWMDGRPIRPGRFYANRALRILPMYFVAVALGGLYHRDAVTALPALVFWNIGIATLFPFGAVWWSLVPEVQFYAVLPGLHALWRSQLLRWPRSTPATASASSRAARGRGPGAPWPPWPPTSRRSPSGCSSACCCARTLVPASPRCT